MPKTIAPDVFASLAAPFDSVLPSSAVVNGQVAPQFAQLARADFGRMSLENTAQLAGRIGKSVALTAGWPEGDLSALVELVGRATGQIPTAAAGALLDLAGDVVPEALSALEEAITDAVSNVPILGWVAKLALGVWAIVDAVRQRPPPPKASIRALVYDRDADGDLARSILADLADADWTRIWLPPSAGFAAVKLAYTASGEADGWAWGQIGGSGWLDAAPPQRGVAPGLTAWAGYWQAPRTLPGSSRDAGPRGVVGVDELAPASTNLAGLAWDYLQRPGPRCCSVEHAQIKAAWKDYGDELRAFAKAQPGDRDKYHGLSWLGMIVDGSWRWWQPGAAYDDPGQYLDALVGAKVDKLYQRTRRLLDTIAVAYVPADAPALRDPALRKAWADNRVRLLSHDAVQDVDASLVVPADYRAAVVAAQKTASGSLVAGPVAHRVPPTMDGAKLPPPEPPELPRRRPGAAGASPASAGLGLAAGVAALVYLLT